MGNAISSAASSIGSGVSNLFSGLGNTVSNAASSMFGNVTPFDAVGTIGSDIVPQAVQTFVPDLVDTPSLLGNIGSSLFSNAGSVASSLIGTGGWGTGDDWSSTGSPGIGSSATPVPDPVSPVGMNPGEQAKTPISLPNLGSLTPTDPVSIAKLASRIVGPNGQPAAAPGSQPDQPAATNPLSGLLNTRNLALTLAALSPLINKGNLGPDADTLRSTADSLKTQSGNLMETSLANQQGMINGQALNSIQRSLNQKQAMIRQSYQQMGMSGSTMEAQDLGAASDAAEQEIFAVGQEMATSGLQTAAALTGQETGIYDELMQAQVQQDEELSKAIAAFAGASVK